jgi:hypothetical protein
MLLIYVFTSLVLLNYEYIFELGYDVVYTSHLFMLLFQ